MAVKDLIARLKLNAKDFEKGLKRSEKKSNKFSKTIKKVGGVIAAAFAGKAIIGAIKKFTFGLGDAADRLLDLEQITGMTTTKLQEYQNVAKQAGVNSETISNAVQGLTRRMSNATSEASPFNRAMSQMGVNARNADGSFRGTGEVMDDLIMQLSEMEDTTKRNTIGQLAFGGAWADMAPILSMGADGINQAREQAHELGMVMDREAIVKANEFRQSVEVLKARVQGIGIEIGSKLIPIFKSFTDWLSKTVEWGKENEETLKRWGKIIAIFTGLVVAQKAALLAYNTVTKTLRGVVRSFIAIQQAYSAVVAASAVVTGKATFAQKRLIVSSKILNKVLKANPYAMIATAIIAAVTAIVAFTRKTKDAISKQKELNKINKQAEEAIGKQTSKIRTLKKTVKNNNLTLEQRRKALKKIEETTGKSITNINLEEEAYGDLDETTNQYIETIKREAVIRAMKDKITEATRKKIEAENAELGENLNVAQKGAAIFRQWAGGQMFMVQATLKNTEVAKEEKKKRIDEAKDEMKFYEDMLQEQMEKWEDFGVGGGGGDDDDPNPDRPPDPDPDTKRIRAQIDMELIASQGAELMKGLQGQIDQQPKLKVEMQPIDNAALDMSSFLTAVDATESWGKKLEMLNEKLIQTKFQYGANSEQVKILQEQIKNVIEANALEIGIMNQMQSNLAQGAQSWQEYGASVVSAVKDAITAYLAETIAASIKNSAVFAGHPLAAAIMAGISVGAMKTLFNTMIPSFAEGGTVRGPTLAMVGDNPSGVEHIIPDEKLRAMAGGGGMELSGNFVLRGNDLVASIDKTNARNKRK